MRTVKFFSDGVEMAGDLREPEGAGPHPVVIFCAGMSLVKEVWLPAYADALVAAGYVTLNFDYRGFGASAGEPRRRLLPMRQVDDVRNAISFLETLGSVDRARIGLFGASLGASVATYAGGIDPRVKAVVGIAGPADLDRVWRAMPNFQGFYAKVMDARRKFVTTGEVTYVPLRKILSSDPETCDLLEREAPGFPTWKLDVTFESLADLFEFRPESVVSGVRSSLFIYTAADELISRFEMQSLYSKAREPRELLGLEGIRHAEIYGQGRGFQPILEASRRFFDRELGRA